MACAAWGFWSVRRGQRPSSLLLLLLLLLLRTIAHLCCGRTSILREMLGSWWVWVASWVGVIWKQMSEISRQAQEQAQGVRQELGLGVGLGLGLPCRTRRGFLDRQRSTEPHQEV